MIFVIDVGNTNMTMGVFQGKKMEATFRICLLYTSPSPRD